MDLNRFGRKLSLIAVPLVLAFAATSSAQQRSDGQGAPDDAAYDQIVDQFIQYDIGAIRDPVAIEQIRGRFNGLRVDEAVPALVRGLNKSTRMRASCPITALTGKLRTILGNTKNPEVATHVLRNLEQRDVGSYNSHVRSVFSAADQAVLRTKGKELATQQFKRRFENIDDQRLAYVPGLKFTDLSVRDPQSSPSAAEEPTNVRPSSEARPSSSSAKSQPAPAPASELRKLSVSELADRLNDRASQARVLEELHRRASSSDAQAVAKHAESIAKALTDGDDVARESAARLIGLVRIDTAIPQLIDALEDSNAKVRSAASMALARITRQLFGPSDNATSDETKFAVARWRDWWNRR